VSAVEAIAVVLLISTTAVAATYKMSSAPPIDPARVSAQSFAEMLRDARETAIKNHSRITVSLDQSSSPARWTFCSTQSTNSSPSKWELPVDQDVKVEGTIVPIRIDDHGNASYFGEWKFVGQTGYHVTLQPIGARVTMKAID
jgi:hypothetical protein